MVETIRSLGHPRLVLYVLRVTIVGNPACMRVGRKRQRQFVSGNVRAAVETAVDHGCEFIIVLGVRGQKESALS